MSLTIVAPVQSGHWYGQDGTPAHDADLRRARKEKLLPSVTSVLSVLAKPALETWKINQAILASLTLPRREEESDQDFAARVVRDWKEQSGAAADLGTRVHTWAEDFMAGKSVRDIPEVSETLKALAVWIGEQKWEHVLIEDTLTNPELGYAGRIDLQATMNGRRVILDWKTSGNKDGKLEPYQEYCWQLAAYGEGREDVDYINVMLSTNPARPGTRIHQWTPEEIAQGWEAFRAALKIWRIQKNYDPRV